MKKLLIRLIPDAIYEALEKTALHSERSLEAQARYILSFILVTFSNTYLSV